MEAGRAAVVARLRALATRIEELRLDAAAEVLTSVEPAVATFERHVASHLNAHSGLAPRTTSTGTLAVDNALRLCGTIAG